MKSVNLIPVFRRDAKRRRARLVASATVCGGYAALLACGVAAAAHLLGGPDRNEGRTLAGRVAATEDDIRRLTARAAELRAELVRARTSLEANRTIGGQPDWSVLLALLAETLGDDVVLRSVSVAPPPAPSAPATASANVVKEPPEVVLELAGVGQTQLAVSRHVLRLEQTGLFAQVTLVETGREAFLNSPAIGFRLRCTFGDGVTPQVLSSSDAGGITR